MWRDRGAPGAWFRNCRALRESAADRSATPGVELIRSSDRPVAGSNTSASISFAVSILFTVRSVGIAEVSLDARAIE
jgi:hypothetical protein